jgi:ubiquitin-small subunit ribosomal protein S27Ae
MAPAPKKEEPATKAADAAVVKKAEKGKKEKKHKEEKGVKAMYKVEANKLSRARPTCERCGTGYFMADHHSRYTCGHCGLTRYKQK